METAPIKTTLTIEQFDNGITLRSEAEGYDPTAQVVLEGSEIHDIGKLIWEDCKYLMDNKPTNKITLHIQYST